MEKLKAAGLLDFESVDIGGGQKVTSYRLTEKGRGVDQWPIAVDSRGFRRASESPRVGQRILELESEGQPITIAAVQSSKDPSDNPLNYQNTVSVLSFFTRHGLLERSKFHEHMYSKVWLTPLGKQVVARIIKPLEKWTRDPLSVPYINEIETRLSTNPNAYAPMYRLIARSFVEN